MSKNKGKRNIATPDAIKHGLETHWLHLIHSKESKECRNVVFVAHEVVDGTDYHSFRSDLSELGHGRNWIVRDGKLELREGGAWINDTMKIMADCMKYQQRMRVASKDGGYKIRYVSRKVEDRKKKGPTDLKGRSLTDLKRETIDLRPDHSRVLQYLVEDGRKEALRPILAEIQAEQIRLFEEVHPGRKVRSLGEHTDSGQFHFDHWHSGIEEMDVQDNDAIVTGELGDEKILVAGKTKKIRWRHVFRSYGVSDGMASYDRHRSALADSGHDETSLKSIMGYTLERLEGNTVASEDQNGEYPRDLRLWRAIDKFVDEKLRGLDAKLCNKARSEYAEWLGAGYDLQKLGIKPETLEESKHKRRKKELETLRAAVRTVLEMILAIPGVMDLLRVSETLMKKLDELMTMVAPTTDPSVEPKKRRGSKPAGNEDSEQEM